MINKKYIFIISICCTLSMSFCTVKVPNTIQKNFTNCYCNDSTRLDSLININGYYVITDLYNKEQKFFDTNSVIYNNPKDTFYLNIMFFNDGLYVRNFGTSLCDNNYSCIKQYCKDINEDLSGVKQKEFGDAGYWGCYSIKNDTIIVQQINYPSPPCVWIASEIKYKVMDRNTIVEVDSKPIHYMSESDWKNYFRNKKPTDKDIATFKPLIQKPNSDCWLKKEDWFWCNKRK